MQLGRMSSDMEEEMVDTVLRSVAAPWLVQIPRLVRDEMEDVSN